MKRSFSIATMTLSLNRAMTLKAATTVLHYNATTTRRNYNIVFHDCNGNYRSNIDYNSRQLSTRLNPVTSREGEDLNAGHDHASNEPERQRAILILKFSKRYRLLINRIVNYL